MQTHNPGPKVSKFQRKAPFYYQFYTRLNAHKPCWARNRTNCYHTMTQERCGGLLTLYMAMNYSPSASNVHLLCGDAGTVAISS